MFYHSHVMVSTGCGAMFERWHIVDGRRRDLSGRQRCLECAPFRPLRAPRRSVSPGVKIMKCLGCGEPFAARQIIDGKKRTLYRRSFCLTCSPFASRNSSRSPVGRAPDALAARKARRRESYRRSLRKRRHSNKRELVTRMGGRCTDCGYDKSVLALEFHHRVPSSKSFALGGFGGSRRRFEIEALKCDLVCANCHRRRHALEDDKFGAAQVEFRRRTKLRAIRLHGAACYSCDGEFPPPVFEFHHRDGKTKEFGVAAQGLPAHGTRSWPSSPSA